MAIEQNAHKSLLDVLYCEEEKWEDNEEDEESVITSLNNDIPNTNLSLFPLLLLEQDFFWDDEELQSLFSKERETFITTASSSLSVSLPRKEAVEWILKINGHYGFSALTSILAVNYLDRFLSSLSLPQDKPWMMQLSAVTCLSLAAKVEETHVPLLLDLQVEGTKYVFEAKTIQKMELLVLSGLKWRMNPVTPLSFLDHIVRRLGLKTYIHWEFLRRCENLLLSVISDPRFTLYLPSVLATSTMLHVIHQFEPRNAIDYENQLLGVLKITKEEVNESYELISEVLLSNTGFDGHNKNLKRKFCQGPGSPDAVMDAVFSSDDDYDSSSPNLKKTKTLQHHQIQMRLPISLTTDAPH